MIRGHLGRVFMFTSNHLERRADGKRPPWTWWHRSVHVMHLPRLILLCRVFGHRPVVDGTNPNYPGGHASRWVACTRCGERGNPQGRLEPALYQIGDRYEGPWRTDVYDEDNPDLVLAEKHNPNQFGVPGPIRRRAEGDVGLEVKLGRTFGGTGFEVKIGNCGSDHVFAAQLSIWPLLWISFHTAGFGRWLQLRFNPTGYESRVTGFRFWRGGFEWKLWAPRDRDGGKPPWWQQFEIRPRLLDRLLGRKQYRYVDVAGAKTSRMIRMPERDYLVSLQLQKVSAGRERGRRRESWSVDWSTVGSGIPTKGIDRGRVYGSHVTVSAEAVREGMWPSEAAAEIARKVTGYRIREGYDPIRKLPINMTEGTAMTEEIAC